MDLKSIEIFCKLVENGSFSKTAEEFFVTQPAISKQISLLEKSLNVKLINRTTKVIQLTRAGEVFYNNALKVLREFKTLELIMRNFAGLNFGKITIGASTLPGEYILPKLIGDFKKFFSDVNINLIIKDSLQIIEDILSGLIEIGIVGSKFNKKGLIFEDFIEDEIVFAGKKNIKIIDINDIKNIPVITREKGSGTINCVKNFLQKKKFDYDKLKFIAIAGSLNAVKQMIINGVGYSFISRLALEEEIKNGKIKLINIDNVTPIKRMFYIVYSSKFTLSPVVEKLKNILIDKKRFLL